MCVFTRGTPVTLWPWTRQGPDHQLVISWADQILSYVLARKRADGTHEVLRFGFERHGVGDQKSLLRKLKQLDLKQVAVRVMLRPGQYQMLQIDSPAVPPDELRAATRYQIRDLLHIPLADVAIDVMRVGDGRQRGAGRLFVVATPSALLRAVVELCQTMHWRVVVIDVQETAQRNLETALAAKEGRTEGANASLMLVEGQQIVLTISANKELFYTRRFDLPEELLTDALETLGDVLANEAATATSLASDLTYQPAYSLDYLTYGDEIYPDTETVVSAGTDDDPTKRFLVELLRSLDLWNRYWRDMPIHHMHLYAGARSQALATWLAVQLGRAVLPMNVEALFPDFKSESMDEQALCLPLLGLLLRDEDRQA